MYLSKLGIRNFRKGESRSGLINISLVSTRNLYILSCTLNFRVTEGLNEASTMITLLFRWRHRTSFACLYA